MANRMPSLLALLGLAAVAGYQHRDKIAEVLNGLGNKNPSDPNRGQGSILDGLGNLLGSAGGGSLTGGLNDLLNTFKTSGQSEVADSWVTPGVPTKGLTPQEVERAIGDDNLSELSDRTGLSRQELLQRLATAIPEAVDKLTPDGRFPTEDEARGYFGGQPPNSV